MLQAPASPSARPPRPPPCFVETSPLDVSRRARAPLARRCDRPRTSARPRRTPRIDNPTGRFFCSPRAPSCARARTARARASRRRTRRIARSTLRVASRARDAARRACASASSARERRNRTRRIASRSSSRASRRDGRRRDVTSLGKSTRRAVPCFSTRREKRRVRRSHEGSARATRAQPRAVKPLVPSVSSFSNAAAKSSKKTF